jgi:phage I-like protein
MALIKSTLKTALENTLKTEFKSDNVKNALRKKLDGGTALGAKTSAISITKALDNIADLTSVINFGTSDQSSSQTVAKETIKKITANEWSNAIADSICEWMSEEIAPILAKTISDEIDKYIKTATVSVTIPIGLVTQGASTAAIPNPAPISIKGATPPDPISTLFPGGLS